MERLHRISLLITFALLLSPPETYAQVPSSVDPIPGCQDLTLSVDANELARFAARGEWVELQRAVQALLGETKVSSTKVGASNGNLPPPPIGKTLKECLGPLDKRVIFVFAAKNALNDRTLYSVIYPTDQPFEELLPGLSGRDANAPQLYEVFVVDRPGAKLQSVYTATRQDNPLTGQAISAVSANVSTVLTGVGALTRGIGSTGILSMTNKLDVDTTLMGQLVGTASPEFQAFMKTVDPQSKDQPPRQTLPFDPSQPVPRQQVGPAAYASVAQVRLSIPRAKVDVVRRANVPKVLKDLEAEVDTLVADIRVREALNQPIASAFASKLKDLVTLGVNACEAEEKNRAEPFVKLAKPSPMAFAVLRDQLQPAVVDCRPYIAQKVADEFSKLSEEQRKVAESTYVRVRNYVADLAPFKIDQKVTVINEPKERVALGAMTGFVVGGSKKTRVKADGGKIVSDPLPRVLTAVGVHVSTPYQPSLQDTMKGLAFFVGVALTPNIGIAAGGSWRFVKGLSLTVGGALLAVPTGELDAEAPKKGQPFATTGFGVGFVGLTFNVK
ncbi:MAG: hypothetical protein ACRD2N_10955 [Vicinamibacterales bacterium]